MSGYGGSKADDMLNELEAKLTAVVADAVATRDGLSVEGSTNPPAPAAGTGVVQVGLTDVSMATGFEPGQRAVFGGNGATASRRVVPLRFGVSLDFARRPAESTESATAAARRLLLEDISLIGHALTAATVRAGTAFIPATADPGFEVRSFELVTATMPGRPDGGLVRGVLVGGGQAVIWPPGSASAEGEILAVDGLVAALPVGVTVHPSVVTAGGSATVRIRGVGGARLLDPTTGQRAPARLAVGVLSDLTPAQRGTITSGEPAIRAGFRIVPVQEPETVVAYQAPSGDLGATRTEQVAVHLATGDGATGLPLGVVVVALRPGSP